jgi:hypothetical protein
VRLARLCQASEPTCSCRPTAPSCAGWPPVYAAARLRPLIDKTFPFDQTLEALAYVEQGRANGKAVITLD